MEEYKEELNKNIMDIEKAEAYLKEKYKDSILPGAYHAWRSDEVAKEMQEYSNQQNAKLLQKNKELLEDKIHYEALKDCCNSLLDSVDIKNPPTISIIGLRILLNRKNP